MSSTQSTSFDVIYQKFFDKVENDPDFFDYYNIPEDKAMEIAVERASNLLKDAIEVLMTKCSPDVDFFNYDNELGCFNFKVYPIEIKLLCDIMYEIYLEKYLIMLKPIINTLTSSDIKALFSPANERKTYQELCKYISLKNEKSISKYIARDRVTNKLKSIYDNRR